MGLRCLVLILAAAVASPKESPSAVGVFEGHSDVGAVLHSGSTEYDAASKAYRVTASGENVWGRADAFQFVWKKVSGDVSIAAEVAFEASGGDPHKKAMLMLRQSLDADSAYADVAVHGSGFTSLQSRDEKGAATHEVQANISGPKRVRITKSGDYFYLSVAAEGEELHPSGASMKVVMQDPYYVGIGVSAHNKDAVETAFFRNVELRQAPAISGQPKLYSALETVTVASTDRRVVYTAPGRFESPSWTKDGMLQFNGGGQSFRISPDGGKPEVIETSTATRPGAADGIDNGRELSPDGQFIYFNSNRSGLMQLWRMKPDGTEPEQVTPDDGYNNWFPHVSPDGQRIVFLTYDKGVVGHPEDKDVTLRVLTLTTGRISFLAKLLGGPGTINLPSWSPNGRRLAFVSYQLMP